MRLIWEAFHQVFVHPLLFFSRNASWAQNLHDMSSEKAWPKEKKVDYESGYTALLNKVKRAKKEK